ncbi:sugar nucleotide-binding protein, partial [Inquilinus limosus]
MKIIVIGATGTIGSAVAAALEPRHRVVRASRRGSPSVDMADPESIAALLAEAGPVDAVICCAASARMAPIDAPDEAFLDGLHAKLLGQVALLRLALPRLRDG